MKNAAQSIDHQVMWNRLLAVVEEQGQALIRTAFSPIVRECGDISAGIFDEQGRMLAQAVTGTPGHINTMAEAVKSLISIFPVKTMQSGDVYVTNDPWLASGHLNDFLLLQPVFLDNKVVGLTSCTANSRGPVANEGDLYALISCCEVGAVRLEEMMREFGISDLGPLTEAIIATSRKGAVAAITEVPNGVYENALTIDGYEFEIELKARMTVSDEEILLDFSGSSGCSKYGINVPLNYATAYSVFAVRCLVGPEVPNNAGSLEPFRVIAPEGCIVNAQRPAPVAMRHTIGQLMPDLVLGCLHQAMPEKVPAEGASCMYDLPMRNVPNLAPGATPFAIELAHNGGTGARPMKDGLSATAYPSGVWGSQVEVTENTVPVLIRRRELRPGSGGAGKYRGGLGQIIEVESSENQPFLLFLSLERMKHPAQGRDGGGAGAAGRVAFQSGKSLPGKGEAEIPGNERLCFETPGGGGMGHPFARDPQQVALDVRRGLVSPENARRQYGVVLSQAGIIDSEGTSVLRGSC